MERPLVNRNWKRCHRQNTMQTDRQTDRWQYDAISRSYYMQYDQLVTIIVTRKPC